jgi:hypothetical protein
MIIKSKSLKNIITIFQYFIHGWKEIKKKLINVIKSCKTYIKISENNNFILIEYS